MPTPGVHVQTNKSHTTAFRHRGCVSYVAVVSGIILTAGLHSAFAADRGLGLQPGLPTESNDVAEPEAAVSSEAPFQKLVQLGCSGSVCQVNLPAVQRRQRQVIQFISCQADTSVANSILDFVAFVVDGNTNIAGHLVAPAFEGAGGTHALASQPILLTVPAHRFLRLQAEAASGNVSAAACGVSGLTQTLR